MISVCPSCKFTVGSLIFDPVRKENFCSWCFFRLNPPMFVLVRKWNHAQYFCTLTGRTTSRTIQDFEKCGFHLFNQKTYRSIQANPRAEEILTFYFKGKVSCNLIGKYYRFWPVAMPSCENKNCI